MNTLYTNQSNNLNQQKLFIEIAGDILRVSAVWLASLGGLLTHYAQGLSGCSCE